MNDPYSDAGGIAAWTQRLLWLQAALQVVSAALALTRDALPVGKAFVQLLGLAQVLGFFACVVMVLIWIHRANVNARALGAGDMIVSPGWAVGWFFVPLANLALPFVAVREIWRASANPKDWQLVPAPITIPVWWGCWLASGFTAMVGFRLGVDFDSDAQSVAPVFTLISTLFSIAAALLLAHIVGGIQALQERAAPGAAFA